MTIQFDPPVDSEDPKVIVLKLLARAYKTSSSADVLNFCKAAESAAYAISVIKQVPNQ
jgi:hypothetical protein